MDYSAAGMEADRSLDDLDNFGWDPSLDFTETPSTWPSDVATIVSPSNQSQSSLGSATGHVNALAGPAKSQVCSTCRRKKRKCSLERPACSLCREGNWKCDYGWIKKKPGPAKGSVGLKVALMQQQSSLSQHVPQMPAAPARVHANIMSVELRNKMLDLYFSHVNVAYPIICRNSLLQALPAGQVPEKLLNAMFATASFFIPASETPIIFGTEASEDQAGAFAQLATKQHTEQNDRDGAMSLDDVRTELLLTIYAYTAFPGRKAWMMVGKLVRTAYSIGLHRLDCDQHNGSLNPFELEERRFVWWSVWKLDSAINTLTFTPFTAHAKVNGTAFVSTSKVDFAAGNNAVSTQQFLPPDSTRLWMSASQVLATDTDDGMNMYLFAVNYMRATSECIQGLHSGQSADLVGHLMTMRNTLSCLRLALPTWYFETPRQSSETLEGHWLRLESVLIIYSGHHQLFFPRFSDGKEDVIEVDALAGWKICVSVAEDIAAVFHHWQPKYFTMADPMISTIIWLAHVTLTLHLMCKYGLHEEYNQVRITNALDLLGLALDRFAQHWPLSRLLQGSVKELQSWTWMKLEFPEVLSAVAQLRVPIDPHKQNPGTIDMWNMIGRPDPAMALSEDDTPKDQ